LEQVWQTKIEGKLTSLTVAAGKVFVSRVDAHTVYALNADSGEVVWRRTVGGPVDSPPTVYVGRISNPSRASDGLETHPTALCLFGCRDGWVYCLKADDGRLAWRFRAAPEDRRLVAMQNVESVWPVHGSVLVRDGKAWFAAGRSPFLDGGIRIYALNAASGKVVAEQTVFARGPQQFNTSRPQGGKGVTRPGLPDIMSACDGLIYMRWMAFDGEANIVNVKPHLFSATGFLDDTWWHRTYWQYGTWMRGGFGGWPQAAQQAHTGRIMVAGDKRLFGFARTKYDAGNGGDVHAGHIGLVKRDYQDRGRIDPPRNPYRLYAAARPDPNKPGKRRRTEQLLWHTPVPVLVRAMLLADRTLFIAGPRADPDNRSLAELTHQQPASLLAVSADDGKTLAKCNLASAPVFDGMAATAGRLFMTTTDGSVVCLGSEPSKTSSKE